MSNLDSYRQPIILSLIITFLITMLALCVSEECRHWFIIPISFAGIMMGVPATLWFTSRESPFEAITFFGLYGYFFFYLAPLLNILTDKSLFVDIVPYGDLRPFLGIVGFFSCIGILLLFLSYMFFSKRMKPRQYVYKIVPSYFFSIMPFFVFFTIILAVMKFALKSEDGSLSEGNAIFHILRSELCITLFIFFYMKNPLRGKRNGFFYVLCLCITLLALQIFLVWGGGRIKIVILMFYMAAIVHASAFKIKKSQIILFMIPLIIFMNVFKLAVYSKQRDEGFHISSFTDYRNLSSEYSLSGMDTLLIDFSRSDLHAVMISRMYYDNVQLAYGQTYISVLGLFIPHQFRPELNNKDKVGLTLLHGGYDKDVLKGYAIFGMSGEGMMNFGYLGYFPPFILLGFLLALYKKYAATLGQDDLFLLIHPILFYYLVSFVAFDLENVVAGLVFNIGSLTLILWMISRRVPISRNA